MNALYNANIKGVNSKGFASFAFPEAKAQNWGVGKVCAIINNNTRRRSTAKPWPN